MLITLFNLPIGAKGIIKKINTPKSTEERLHSFGLVKNTEISHLMTSPLGCPRIYKCLNAQIAIRNDDARAIEVEYEGNII